ncbi:MAG: PilZ domain-containing protein [Nitrospirae bacterium]|nr:PilZ domain-containing protein [Nitrospirota bacterium]
MKKEKSKEKRRLKRYTERCETEFTAYNTTYRGLSDNFSLNGFFIRTIHLLPPGKIIDILIHLPDGSISQLKGKVVRDVETLFEKQTGTQKYVHNGMGVEIIEKDINYLHFVRSLLERK